MKTKKILFCGNEAAGEAAALSGCAFYAGYPITPQNELTAYMSNRMSELRHTFIQAESELAAINMVFGASAAGARAMTSSSSPGISLKQEGISYMAACQLPGVIINMVRGGPGLGNIAPAQSDYFQATRGGGHGDYRLIVLAPASVQEMFDLTCSGFDLADIYRMPVMILGDGILGQMMEPMEVPDQRIKKLNTKNNKSRKYLTRKIKDKTWTLAGCYNRRPNVIRSLLLKEGALEELNARLQEKYKLITRREIRQETQKIKDADLILVAYGSVSRICHEVMLQARALGLRVGLIRPITLWPFPYKVINKAAAGAKAMLAVEMSAGQMIEDVRLGVEGQCPVFFHGRCGGGIPKAEVILKKVRNILKRKIH